MDGLLRLANLARSTFYYQVGALQKPDKHADLKATIQSLYHEHEGRFGYRRITLAIRKKEPVNEKRVQRLMDDMNLKSLVRPKRYRSYKGLVGKIAPNLLERNFLAQRPNQKWVTDVTEFKVGLKRPLSYLFVRPGSEMWERACSRKSDSDSAGDVFGQTLIDDLIKRTALGPVAHEPRPIPRIRRGKAAERAVLTHRIQVDQRPAILLPEQVVPLEIPMADPLANQLGKQMIQRQPAQPPAHRRSQCTAQNAR